VQKLGHSEFNCRAIANIEELNDVRAPVNKPVGLYVAGSY
jgi:hypothetical protein